ncbi:MAG: PAS domain S-box protein [Deltaproteobacteria bacterium]|nr:PAS domain S-box protein [Deltaproteobacteria bacterium]
MRLRLSQRFNLIIGAILLAGILMLVYFDVGSDTRLMRHIGINEAERLSNALFDQLYTSMRLGGGREENRAIVERFNAMNGVAEIRVLHGPALDMQYGPELDEMARDELDRDALGGVSSDVFEKIRDGVSSVRRVSPVFLERACIRCHTGAEGAVAGVISMRLNFEDHENIISAHTRSFLIWGGAILVATFVAVLATVNYCLLKPLNYIKGGVDALASGDLSYRLNLKTGDELEDLGAAFDGMTESLLQATTRLNELNEKYTKLVQMAVDAIVLIDIETRRFVDVNPAAVAITGYSREELLVISSEELYPDASQAEYGSAFDRWVFDGKGYLRDAELFGKNGMLTSVEIAASVLELGRRKYMIEIWRDTTERKGFIQTLNRNIRELEETVAERTDALSSTLKELETAYGRLKDSESKLIQTAKMTSLGEMGAGIAHELNSPIAGILSITEVLMARTDKNDPKYYFLEKVKDAAVRSKYIIQDMLAYARPARSGFAPVLLNEVITATLCLFISEIKTSAIDIVKDIKADLSPVYANKGQIMEVMLNIIKNARDAMHGKGRIFISTYEKEEAGARYAVAEIRDTGPGISPDALNKMFDPFFSTKEKGGGLNIGLGLSISQSIMNEHNGRIEGANAPGSGAVFRIFLPVHDDSTAVP